MARTFTVLLPATSFIPDQGAQLVAGDVGASFVSHLGRPALSFDDTAEEAATSFAFEMPDEYAAGTLKASVFFHMASDATNDVAIDVFVEAVTPGTDTIDLEAASGWDSANSGTLSVGGTTAGDPLVLTITLTNKDSVASADQVRIGIRRDCDSVNDDAAGDMFVTAVSVFEEA